MTHRVLFSPEAQVDVRQLYLYIARKADPSRALDYVSRIEAFCSGLAEFPQRGTWRDDLYPGLRTTGFEPRVTVAFTVEGGVVTVLRALYGGRDLDAALDPTRPPISRAGVWRVPTPATGAHPRALRTRGPKEHPMIRALPLVALLILAGCVDASQPATPAPTGITANRGGGAQQLGNQGIGNPIAVTPTSPVR